MAGQTVKESHLSVVREDDFDQCIWGVDAREAWADLVAKGPVIRSELQQVVTGPAEVDEALHTPAVFSSNPAAADFGIPGALIPLQIDPPEHKRYRKMLDPLFSPRRMAVLEDEVVELVNGCIDEFIESGSCDFAQQIAFPVPSGTFLALLGLSLDGLAEFIRVKDDMIRPGGTSEDDSHRIRADAATWMFTLFSEELEKREHDPGDDILTELVAFEQAGRLSRDESLNICFLQLMAGLDTVTDSLGCFYAFLGQAPEHRKQLADDPDLIPMAIEELLRWETPVPTLSRVAMADVELGGCPIKADDKVRVLAATMNYDPNRLENPTVVDFRRSSCPHVSFGAGVHRCLGSNLARLELRVVMREWHRRIPEYEMEEGHELLYRQTLRELEHLPLRFPAGTRQR